MPKSYKYHCNLTSKNFPFSCDELSSTVFINQGREQNRQLLQGFDGRDVVDSFGICQTWFMSNVMPITRGFSSVYYKRVIGDISSEEVEDITNVPKDQVIVLRENYDSSAILVPAFGHAFVYDPQQLGWKTFTLSGFTEGMVTSTYLKGKTYVCFAGVDLVSYNFDTKTLDSVPLTGAVGSTMLGVASSLNYLLLWNSNYLFWSSDTDPTDFLPSLVTGSGSSKLLAQKGSITCILPISDGFIVYTTMQAIAATYSGNANDPWIFREIAGSGGVASAEHVAYGTAEDNHIAWTSSGFQVISMREASPIWPELSDSIAREIFTGFSNQRTYNYNGMPIHENYGGLQTNETTAEHTDPDNVGDHYLELSKYPFHYTHNEDGYHVPVDHIKWHKNLVSRQLKTSTSVPTRVDWKGPFRIKVNSVGERYIAVSVGVYQDKEFQLTDAGLSEDGTSDGFPVDSNYPMVDPTPAYITIGDKYPPTEIAAVDKKFYDFAYIYDKALNRWGRLDCEHIDFFEFSVPQFTVKITYEELLRREALGIDEGGAYRYQDFQSIASHDYFLANDNYDASQKIAYSSYYTDWGTFIQPESDVTYAALGIEQELRTSQFGENFGVVSRRGGVFLVKLFDGKYFQEVQRTEGYDAAAALMRQEDESGLALQGLPHLCHGRYKVSRDSGSLLHSVTFSKIAAAGIVSVWALPHAEDGECLAPIPFNNIQTINQTKEVLDAQSAYVRQLHPGDPTYAQPAYSTQLNWMMGDHGRFAGRAAGDSVSILLAGHFTLTDLTINLEAFGSRNMPVSNSLEAPVWWHVREVMEYTSDFDMNGFYDASGSSPE